MNDERSEPIHVLSTMAFPAGWLDRLRAVSPRLLVTQHSCSDAHEVPASVWERTEVLYSGHVFPDINLAGRLRWLQLDTSGVDHILNTPIWGSDIAVTTLGGVAPSNMAEFVLMMMLGFAHHLPKMVRYQLRGEWPSAAERWQHWMPAELRGATVGIVGYGSIGRQVGSTARALGMRVLGLHRGGQERLLTYRIAQLGMPGGDEPDQMFAPGQLHELLAQSDYVVLIVPYTSATHHMIDARALAAMKPTAVLINIARGGVVDEQALALALAERRIAAAALDVFEHEPLPAHSPLWSMDNVVISPHVAGLTPHYYERVFELFAENLRRYMDGHELLNRASREREY